MRLFFLHAGILGVEAVKSGVEITIKPSTWF